MYSSDYLPCQGLILPDPQFGYRYKYSSLSVKPVILTEAIQRNLFETWYKLVVKINSFTLILF